MTAVISPRNLVVWTEDRERMMHAPLFAECGAKCCGGCDEKVGEEEGENRRNKPPRCGAHHFFAEFDALWGAGTSGKAC